MSEIPRCATCNHRLTEHGDDACTVQGCACLFYMPQATERSDVLWLGGSVTLTRAECLVLLEELGANVAALQAGASTPDGGET